MRLTLHVALVSLVSCVFGLPQIFPPGNAVVVKKNGHGKNVYSSIGAAVNALPADNSSQVVFVYPGTYTEQVNVTRGGQTTLMGYTLDPYTYLLNEVTLTNDRDAQTAGSNDLSGTLRLEGGDVSVYNLNVKNTFGLPRGYNQANQAIAASASTSRVGMYGVSLSGYQDVLLVNAGVQAYLRCHVEGAIDFVFGQHGAAYFRDTTIGITAPANITASGRATNDSGVYLFERSAVVPAPHAWANTSGNVYFGRPWGHYARVVFKDTDVQVGMAPRMWNPWHPGDERTDHIVFAEYNTYGPGVPKHPQRANYTTLLTASEARMYNVSSTLGSDWETWVDRTYYWP